MDKIAKALKKLTEKERKAVMRVLKKIRENDLVGLDIKKLKGYKDIYRIRKGDIRIIIRQPGEDFFVLAIERRSEGTCGKC